MTMKIILLIACVYVCQAEVFIVTLIGCVMFTNLRPYSVF